MSETDLFKSALSRAMALCSKHEYCIDDIRTKLQAWKVGDNDIEKILSALIRDNFINEIRYSEIFVREKFRFNKWGKVKITAHLKSKKITFEIIRSSIDSIDNELYIQTLKDILSEHRKHIKAKNQYDLKGKLLRYGLSKGFESNLLYDLLNDLE
ncbi:MAG: regulatory protein RecX [Bacteroidia bacterium]|nr:regulatory protein RecX [Bacteroidia bacterium]